MDSFNSKVNEKIKIYSNDKYLDGYLKNEFLLDDGTAVIYLNIKDKYELFNSYTANNQLDLKDEIYDFIETKTSILGNHIPIQLNIIGTSFDSKEQVTIKHALKEHFAIELYNKQLEYKKHYNKIVFLICFGIIALIVYGLTTFVSSSPLFLTILSFLFSFSIWEAMDAIIYTISEIKYDREAITQNLLIDVQFPDSIDTEKE